MTVPHVFLTYSIQDAKGATSIAKINFPDSTDIAILKTFAASTATMINAIITGKIISAGIGLEVDLSSATIRSAPDPDSDVEEGARFIWNSAIGALPSFRLPTFDEAKMVSGTRLVDLTDTDVDAFHDRIIAGQTVGLINVSPSDDHGEDIESVQSARESFLSSRN